MLSKKRKIDSENRKFMNEWTELYCFILPERVGAIPVCLNCNSTVAIIKSGNLKRHYETTHKDFHTTFPPASEVRKNKLHASEAALRVCWVLNKHQKPFSDSEIVKECMLEVATALFQENKKIVTSIQDIPLSARSNTRRTEMLTAENKKSLFELLHKSPCYCIALDESCDLVDSEQMSIFVRFFDFENKVFREELLAILTFEGKTRGEDLFKSFDDFMKKSDLSYDKIMSISTDGAPAMMGKEKGLLKRIRGINLSMHNSPNIALYHVRWLSKGRVVERFWNIKEKEVKTFLKNVDTEEAKKHSDFLEKNRNIVAMAFLNDILNFLSDLMKEFDAIFKDFSEIGKLSQFLKTPYDVLPDGEWTDVAEKLFNLSKSKLQIEIIDLQKDVSLKQSRSASTEEFWAKDAIDKYSNCEYQSGFRKGKSTTDHIFVVRQLMEKHYEYAKDLHMVFVDYKQAYDSVNREKL
ncbi:general transcription factor II-I repeat domain-containing protein 2-like [Sipha flava]|uniref:General transcription factor II-I repeat domain-containing protein 2-like n=1 Tax=Sipha flava TaxID=143950 RepID=A0A8B8FYZ9_9HEMI|nr:general transcription factor II-I repeat domain-containing protein 2-like [Sipha flava]